MLLFLLDVISVEEYKDNTGLITVCFSVISIKYFKLCSDNRILFRLSNVLLAHINSSTLAFGVCGISGLLEMRPTESKIFSAIGCLGTIAHFSYLIKKDMDNKKIIRRDKEKALMEALCSDRRRGCVRLPE